MYVYTVMCHKK